MQVGMNRLWVRETNDKRLALEKQIVNILKEELELMKKKKDIYQEYKELVDTATDAYLHQDISVWWNNTTPYIKKVGSYNL